MIALNSSKTKKHKLSLILMLSFFSLFFIPFISAIIYPLPATFEVANLTHNSATFVGTFYSLGDYNEVQAFFVWTEFTTGEEFIAPTPIKIVSETYGHIIYQDIDGFLLPNSEYSYQLVYINESSGLAVISDNPEDWETFNTTIAPPQQDFIKLINQDTEFELVYNITNAPFTNFKRSELTDANRIYYVDESNNFVHYFDIFDFETRTNTGITPTYYTNFGNRYFRYDVAKHDTNNLWVYHTYVAPFDRVTIMINDTSHQEINLFDAPIDAIHLSPSGHTLFVGYYDNDADETFVNIYEHGGDYFFSDITTIYLDSNDTMIYRILSDDTHVYIFYRDYNQNPNRYTLEIYEYLPSLSWVATYDLGTDPILDAGISYSDNYLSWVTIEGSTQLMFIMNTTDLSYDYVSSGGRDFVFDINNEWIAYRISSNVVFREYNDWDFSDIIFELIDIDNFWFFDKYVTGFTLDYTNTYFYVTDENDNFYVFLNNFNFPDIATFTAIDITSDSATLRAYLNTLGDFDEVKVYFEVKFVFPWGNQTIYSPEIIATQLGLYYQPMDNLLDAQQIFFRAIAEIEGQRIYGDWLDFETPSAPNGNGEPLPLPDDNLFAGIMDWFFSFFPDSSTLTAGRRYFIVVISMFLVSVILILGMASVSGEVNSLALYIIGFFNIMFFFMFLALGYIDVLVLIMMGLVIIALAWFKLRSGGGAN